MPCPRCGYPQDSLFIDYLRCASDEWDQFFKKQKQKPAWLRTAEQRTVLVILGKCLFYDLLFNPIWGSFMPK